MGVPLPQVSNSYERRYELNTARIEKTVRCDHDGLKMAEIKRGHLILRAKHHGETPVKIVPLDELEERPRPDLPP